MNEKEKIKKELDEISPFLSKIKEDFPSYLNEPAGYFDQMQNEILDKAGLSNARKKQWSAPVNELLTSLSRYIDYLLKPQIAIAIASVLIVVSAGIWILRNSAENSSISGDEILSYIENNLEDFEADLLESTTADIIDKETFDALELDSESLNKYLLDELEDIDPGSIENLF